MMGWRVFLLTAAAMTAFAANSLLCRLALRGGYIDPASCTTLRLASGALVLWLLMRLRDKPAGRGGSWSSAAALFVYAIAFSFAYVSLPVGVGALLLFGAVQASMLLWGFMQGERLHAAQGLGLAAAVAGLVYLVWPGLAAPPPFGTALMLVAGVAWGVYSLRGSAALPRTGGQESPPWTSRVAGREAERGVTDPAAATAGNFLLAVPFALLAELPFLGQAHAALPGVLCAVTSGAVTSGLGYVIWYAALPQLGALRAAIVQLCVPVLAAFGGVLLLSEPITLRLLAASCAILGGVALAIAGKTRRA